ncbi:phage tail-collar fiber domain-containing protein [Microbulbifer sp. PSTR4-B]|uniref:phage tail-collar fiber domain-containing protein n=1 Tax=unclassified Microbulbifer TaxID=2619833 RepID=UPI00403AE225
MTLALVLTDAGQQAIVDENNAGTLPVKLSHIALGTGRWSPDASALALQQEFRRLPTISGNVDVADDILHLTLRDESTDTYDLYEFGLYTDSGVLFAVYSVGPGADPVANKSSDATLLLSLDIKLAGGNADNIAVGDTGFSNPPATTQRPGVIRISTEQAVDDGQESDSAVSPKTLNKRLNGYADKDHGHSYASVSRDGFIRLASQQTVDDGDNGTQAVTPKTLHKKISDNKPGAAEVGKQGLVPIASQATVNAGANEKEAVTAKTLKGFIDKQFPGPLIYVWGGEIKDIPSTHYLCNGANGTPDLRNRFVLGAGDNYPVGAKGGATSARTSKNGAHSHAITVNNHTLTLAQIPSHRHHHDLGRYDKSTQGTFQQRWILKGDDGIWDNRLDTYTRYSGGGAAHNHTASASTHSGHDHTVAIMPPYYALAYVKRAVA